MTLTKTAAEAVRVSGIEFINAKFWTAKEQTDRLKDLIAFINSGFKFERFTKVLYRWLMHSFGHIAHCNQFGFYDEWFADATARRRWFNHVQRARIYGDNQHTRCDWERVVQRWLLDNMATYISKTGD